MTPFFRLVYALLTIVSMGASNCLAQMSTYAQSADTAKVQKQWYGFLDMYYLHRIGQDTHAPTPSFLYNHTAANELAINQAIIGLKVNSLKIRTALGVHAGTYVNANYAAEPNTLLKMIYEANVGYQIKQGLWIDGGVFSSYIGNETSISYDMWTLTRPVMAENYPYYQSGVKLTYEADKKWLLSALVLNGWQNIAETNRNKPLGAQIQYKPTDKTLLNMSLFYGKEKAAIDTVTEAANRRMFIDLYGIFTITNKLSTALYIDLGSQYVTALQKQVPWYALLGMLRYKPAAKWALCLRGAYFKDQHGIMLMASEPLDKGGSSQEFIQRINQGFAISEFSANADLQLMKYLLLRVEAKTFLSSKKVFNVSANRANMYDSYMLISSMTLKF